MTRKPPAIAHEGTEQEDGKAKAHRSIRYQKLHLTLQGSVSFSICQSMVTEQIVEQYKRATIGIP